MYCNFDVRSQARKDLFIVGMFEESHRRDRQSLTASDQKHYILILENQFIHNKPPLIKPQILLKLPEHEFPRNLSRLITDTLNPFHSKVKLKIKVE